MPAACGVATQLTAGITVTCLARAVAGCRGTGFFQDQIVRGVSCAVAAPHQWCFWRVQHDVAWEWVCACGACVSVLFCAHAAEHPCYAVLLADLFHPRLCCSMQTRQLVKRRLWRLLAPQCGLLSADVHSADAL